MNTHRQLAGSERREFAQSDKGDATPPSRRMSVTVVLSPNSRSKHARSVATIAQRFGLQVGDSPNKNAINLRGTVRQMQRAFQVRLTERRNAEGKYRCRVGPISVPNGFGSNVVAVLGLDTRPQALCHLHARDLPGDTTPNGYKPVEVAAAYGLPPHAGAQHSVGIIELGGAYQSSAMRWTFRQNGIAILPRVSTVGTQKPLQTGASIEVMLDAEIIAALVPRARTVVYFYPNTTAGFYNAILAGVRARHDAISISWGCYDDQTEVLTEDGWRYFKDIRGAERIATLNPTTKELEYQPITQVHQYPYNGTLHRYQGRCTDLLVTPNHNMYARKANRQSPEVVVSSAMFGNPWWSVPKTAKWSQTAELHTVRVAGHEIDGDCFLEFLGYFLSEGWTSIGITHHKTRERRVERVSRLKLRRRKGDGTYATAIADDPREEVEHHRTARAFDEPTFTTGISQTKPEAVAAMQACLDRLPFSFPRGRRGWKCTDKDLCEALSCFGKATDKYVPAWVKQLSMRQLRILYDALMLGDGTRNGRGKQAYYTSSKQLADDMQEIALKLGYVGSITTVDRRGRVNAKGTTRHIEYRVNIKEKHQSERLTRHSAVQYNGMVYCLTVPNHIMYVRRNGCAAWCGNSPEQGWTRAAMTAVNNLAKYAGEHGVTITAASGDAGSSDGTSDIEVDFPASAPYILGCGGTALAIESGAYGGETVWNGNGGATGGGLSEFFPLPAYQIGVANGNTMRMVPDVSATADPKTGYMVRVHGRTMQIGGTSAASPLWAALVCKLNKVLGRRVGFLHEALYALPAESLRAITEGSNGAYSARAPHSLCCGLGTPPHNMVDLLRQ